MEIKEEQINQSINNKGNVYLRVNLTKKGLDFQSLLRISASQLIDKCRQVSKNHHLIQKSQSADAFSEQSKYILIHTGQKIYQSQQLVNLHTSNILYIVNKQEIQKPLLNLNIRFINKNKQTRAIKRFTQIGSAKIIKQTLQDNIALNFNKFIEQVDFFHLGKILQTDNYFCEEYIQDQAEIICIDKLKTPVQIKCSKQMAPFVISNKKFIIKKQSTQILGITQQPYKPTISLNQITKKDKPNWQNFEYGQQIFLNNQQVFNAGAMDVQSQKQQSQENMKGSSSKDEIKTNQQIQFQIEKENIVQI